MATIAELSKQLKDNMDVAEKLRLRRKEIKSSLAKEGLPESDEQRLASELDSVSMVLSKLETQRNSLYTELSKQGTSAANT